MIDSFLYLMLGISGFFLLLGYIVDHAHSAIIGYTFLFLAGIQLLSGLQYQTSVLINQTGITTFTVVPQYATYQNLIMGILVSLAGVVGVALTLIELRKVNKD